MIINNEISPAKDGVCESAPWVSIITPVDSPTAGNFVMKKCAKCKETKPIDKFYNRESGYKCSWCNKCTNESNTKKYRSLRGVIRTLYHNQTRRSIKHGYKTPNYTFEYFKEWLTSQKLFARLYDEWVESGYDKWLKPSIDRIDDYKGYSFDNIQLMTWRENMLKGNRDKKNGVNNKINKAVIQYSMDGELIETHYSIRSAERKTGADSSSISKTCKGIYTHTGGYKWKYNS